MLPVYYVEDQRLIKKANEVVHSMIESHLEFLSDGGINHSSLFPNDIYEYKKEKCNQVVRDLFNWCQDDYDRQNINISALHKYALYKIFQEAEDLEDDYKNDNDGKSLFFSNLIDEDLKDMEFYFDSFFNNYVFLSLDDFSNKYFSEQNDDGKFDFLEPILLEYKDLLPSDIEKYLLEKMKEKYNSTAGKNLFSQLKNIIRDEFIHYIVKYSGYKLLWNNDSPRNEKEAQILFFISMIKSVEILGIDVSPETNRGRGSIDFKFTRGNEKVLLEMKLDNSDLSHALEYQLPEYMLDEKIKKGILLVICYKKYDLENEKKYKESIKASYDENIEEIEIIFVDATNKKKSASNLDEKPTKSN